MCSVVVVAASELICDGTDFVDAFKDVWVKDVGTLLSIMIPFTVTLIVALSTFVLLLRSFGLPLGAASA